MCMNIHDQINFSIKNNELLYLSKKYYSLYFHMFYYFSFKSKKKNNIQIDNL